MRRRPIEFWWISAFSVLMAVDAYSLALKQPPVDQAVLLSYASLYVLASAMLMAFTGIGRRFCIVLLGLEACNQSYLLFSHIGPLQGLAHNLMAQGFCMWMIFYLQSPSTVRLCSRVAETAATTPAAPSQFDILEHVDLGLGFALGLGGVMLGLPAWLAGAIGMGAYVVSNLFMEDLVRRWVELFTRCEPGFPKKDARFWRAACRSMARKDFTKARANINEVSEEAWKHSSTVLFVRMLGWYELLARDPGDGKTCLARAAYDHDWRPNEPARKLIQDYIECSNDEEIRELVDGRAALIEGLVKAGLQPGSFFHNRADRCLSRITGEAFAFNTRESWAAWWDDCGKNWTGDSGLVSLVSRLLRWDALAAAHVLANRTAGRAEEPLLKELTAQILFLNAMHKAIREREGVEPFIKQPQRMLLVPELSDAVGLLHADLQLLENLGMSLPVITRRLNLRVPLVDYISKLWDRYPNDLGADLPWLLQTLTGKNLGILRARAKFQAWWPNARASFLRHDRAIAIGLAALAVNDETGAEKAFRDALSEQPRGLSTRYNLAICVMRRKAHTEAAHLLKELTQLEPKEPYWWMVLGNIHRTVNKSEDAHAAFRRALELGYAPPKVALERGLTFARDQHDIEAIKQFDRALGKNPTAAKIETLVSALESEGLWKLAGHYREEAFRQSLRGGEGHESPQSGDEDVSA